jgi:hypothetical protein
MSLVIKFMNAFRGSEEAHGQTTVGAVGRNGKTEANSRVVREPLTEDLVKNHLEGKHGVGAIPITKENECYFGAIDIDQYDLDHKGLIAKILKFKLPLVVCRSKSGGAHLFCFLKQPTQAKIFREYLTEIAGALGYARAEIFPKQDSILSERGDVGNFINLPYFKSQQTMRYAFDDKGKAMNLEQFLDVVEKKRTLVANLENINYGESREVFADGPPCLQNYVSVGKVDNNRNIFLSQCAPYCKAKYSDNWKNSLEEINQRHCAPPLPASELVSLQNQYQKKDYFYQCNIEPNSSFCNKEVCKSRKFGIGNKSDHAAELSGLTIMLSDPKLVFLDVNGGRLEITMDHLQNQHLFQKACMEQLMFMPSKIKETDWVTKVNEMLKHAVQLEVPRELTVDGQFYDLLETFCTSRIRAQSSEELFMGKPWTEDGKTMFMINGLMEFLRQRNFASFTRAQIQERLKALNDDSECNGHKNLRKPDGGRTTLRVWWVPAFEGVEEQVETEDNDIPF